MVDWTKTFKAEYDYARTYLSDDKAFASDWQPLVRELYKLMDPEGFDPGRAPHLSDLRKKVLQGESKMIGHAQVTEDKGILMAVES